jgi:hypothetical protein
MEENISPAQPSSLETAVGDSHWQGYVLVPSVLSSKQIIQQRRLNEGTHIEDAVECVVVSGGAGSASGSSNAERGERPSEDGLLLLSSAATDVDASTMDESPMDESQGGEGWA